MTTLAQFVTNEAGKKHLIPGQKPIYTGQCVQLIGMYFIDVLDQNIPVYSQAKLYWSNGIPGWFPTTSPQNGDLAIYDGHGPVLVDGTLAYPDGHIAIVYDGEVFEENADPDGSPAHLFPRANTYLLGYLRQEGGFMDPGDYKVNKGDIDNLCAWLLGRAATKDDYARVGATWKQTVTDYVTGNEYRDYISNLSSGTVKTVVINGVNYVKG